MVMKVTNIYKHEIQILVLNFSTQHYYLLICVKQGIIFCPTRGHFCWTRGHICRTSGHFCRTRGQYFSDMGIFLVGQGDIQQKPAYGPSRPVGLYINLETLLKPEGNQSQPTCKVSSRLVLWFLKLRGDTGQICEFIIRF